MKLLVFVILGICHEIALRWMPQDTTEKEVKIVSANGLVPSDNKPLPEPMLTKFHDMWYH